MTRPQRWRALVAPIALLATVAACGGDGAPAGAGGLALRVAWQGSPRGAGVTDACESGAVLSGFGADGVPEVVQRVRVLVTMPERDLSCCIAFDPHAAAVADRRVVLTGLPAGEATVTVSGYASDEVPDAGAATTCLLAAPADFGEACAPLPCAEPPDASCGVEACRRLAFRGEPLQVSLSDGKVSTTGLVPMCAEVMVAGTRPACDSASSDYPVPLELTLVAPSAIVRDVVARLAGHRLAAEQVDLDPQPHPCPDGPGARVPVDANGACLCNDPGGADLPCGTSGLPCCQPMACTDSPDGPRAVSGIVFSGAVGRLRRGCARAGLVAPVATPSPAYVYAFRVAVEPSPTPPPSATVTNSPSATVTATATATATASPTPSFVLGVR